MAGKTARMQVPVPSRYCYDVLFETVDGVSGWNLIRAVPEQRAVMYQHRASIMTSPVTVTVCASPTSSNQTLLILTAENNAAVDPFGILDKALRDFLRHFEAQVPDLVKVVRAETENRIEAGIMCPTCGKELSPGTRFCPEDGTEIAVECSKCGQANTPGSRFCSNCGKELGGHNRL